MIVIRSDQKMQLKYNIIAKYKTLRNYSKISNVNEASLSRWFSHSGKTEKEFLTKLVISDPNVFNNVEIHEVKMVETTSIFDINSLFENIGSYKMNLNKLMSRRERISYAMIEADSESYNELEQELQDIEQEIEMGTGKTIDEIEELIYNKTNTEEENG